MKGSVIAFTCLLLIACGSNVNEIECEVDENCSLRSGGTCLAACSGRRWCAYEETTCPSGQQWSSLDTGDELSGQCLTEEHLCKTPIDAGPDSSPDGSTPTGACIDDRIVFVDNDVDNQELFSIKPDGTSLLNLTKTTAGANLTGELSRDGSMIAFSTTRDGDTELYVMNNDGSNQRNLSVSTGQDSFQAWQPNGDAVLFSSNRMDVNGDIWSARTDGSGVSRLTAVIGQIEKSPSFSRASTRIAYLLGDSTIRIMNADGTQDTSIGSGREPEFHPLEDLIVYRGPTDPSDLFTIDDFGQDPTNLTNTPAETERFPQWSPDGESIAFVVGGTVLVMDASGGNRTPVSTGISLVGAPSWSPDGQRLAFAGSASNIRSIYVVNSNGDNFAPIHTLSTGLIGPIDWGCIEFEPDN